MNILIYSAVYIGYLSVCAGVAYSLRRKRLKNGQTFLKPEFSESFSPIKGAIYFVVYWLVTVFAVKLLALSDNGFLIENSDFFVYLFLTIVAAGLFYRFFLQAIKNIGKNLKENLKSALLIWSITFIVMVAAAVIIALCKIENQNQNAIDESAMNTVCEFLNLFCYKLRGLFATCFGDPDGGGRNRICNHI